MSRSWYLQGFVNEDRQVWKTPIRRNRFLIGRGPEPDLDLPGTTVSTQHALITCRNGELFLRDLGSKNGTFLNDLQVNEETALSEGDILRFSDWEFRLLAKEDLFPSQTTVTLDVGAIESLSAMKFELTSSTRLLDPGGVLAMFQPVVRISDREVMGYEILGRGAPAENPQSALAIFEQAEQIGAQRELSERLRLLGVSGADHLPGSPWLFLNTHPDELQGKNSSLVHSLAGIRKSYPQANLVLEIHEEAVTDLARLRELQEQLGQLDIGLAFDDFGTGQARLLELTEATPRFVKFDRTWIAELHRARESRVELVTTLVRMIRSMGIDPVAEGVEEEAESRAVASAGFEYAQGFFYGRPDLLEPPTV